MPVEDHRMQVDLAAVGVDQEQPGRQPGHGSRVMGEAGSGQGLLRDGQVLARDDEIQVLVWAGLAAEQGINPPAAIQPDHQPGGFELADDPAGVDGVDLHDAAVNRDGDSRFSLLPVPVTTDSGASRVA